MNWLGISLVSSSVKKLAERQACNEPRKLETSG